jgi:hypothetical protein
MYVWAFLSSQLVYKHIGLSRAKIALAASTCVRRKSLDGTAQQVLTILQAELPRNHGSKPGTEKGRIYFLLQAFRPTLEPTATPS